MYKPAKLELRCAIENIIKATLAVDNPLIIKVKSLFEVFDLAKDDRHYQSGIGKKCLLDLHNDYATLCQTVHSASVDINSLDSLKILPRHDVIFSKNLCRMYLRCIENMIIVLYLNYPDIVDGMHPENKKDVLDCLSKRTKSSVTAYLFG